jgi:hypothetical protein
MVGKTSLEATAAHLVSMDAVAHAVMTVLTIIIWAGYRGSLDPITNNRGNNGNPIARSMFLLLLLL